MTLVEQFIQKYGRLPTEFDRDYLEMLRMTKYKILDAPHYKPAKCGNCGSTKVDGRKYIDFGLEIDWYGILYLCSICLNDIARSVGLFDALAKENDFLIKDRDVQMLNYELKLTELHETIKSFEGVTKYLDELRASGNYTDADRVGSVESAKPAIEESNQRPTEIKRQPVKSTPSSRSKNVSSLAELLESPTGK